MPTRFGLSRGILIATALSLLATANAQTAGAFVPTGKLNEARAFHQAIALHNGKVLIMGGQASNGLTPLASAELYDPLAGTFSPTGSMSTARTRFAAILLKDGTVLVAGGSSVTEPSLSSAEIYDPASGTFRPAGNMVTAQHSQSGTLLADGRVLYTDGVVVDNPPVRAPFEVYDPATGAFAPAPGGPGWIWAPTATPLPDGTILMTGIDSTLFLTSAEIYDPASGMFRRTGNLANFGHYYLEYSTTVLTTGQVLFAGGSFDDFFYDDVDTAQVFDPVTATFSAVAPLKQPRSAPTATLLPGGTVLVAGGGIYSALLSAEVYDPSKRMWAFAGSMNEPRRGHTATLLQDGTVLITGGVEFSGRVSKYLDSAELYFPPRIAVSSASLTGPLAPESLASVFGPRLATATAAADLQSFPTKLAGVTVGVRDSVGVERLAPLLYVSPSQINFEVPAGTVSGDSVLDILNDGAPLSLSAQVTSVAPGLFAFANGEAAAYGLRIEPDGTQTFLPAGSPIVLDSRPVYQILFGTGIRNRSSLSNVKCTIEGKDAPVTYAGPSGVPGLDQVNVLLPASAKTNTLGHLVMTVDGIAANTVLVSVR